MNQKITTRVLHLCLSLAALGAQPGTAAPDNAALNYRVAERGPHHRVWSATILRQDPVTGAPYEEAHSYVELATGMHYWDQGQWLESEAKFEIMPSGYLVARRGQHQAILSTNLNTDLPLDWLTSGGQRLKSRIFGLCYYDPVTGQSVLFGEVKDCQAELVAPNVVLDRDAFTDVHADVRITYRLDGWEQDVILREAPPAPSEYQLSDSGAQMVGLTEWFDTPDPVRLGPASPDKPANPGASDQQLVRAGEVVIYAGLQREHRAVCRLSAEQPVPLRNSGFVLPRHYGILAGLGQSVRPDQPGQCWHVHPAQR